MTDNEICTSCNKPKVSSKAGSITQWVNICSCDAKLTGDIPESTINLCMTCGKRIGEGRQGSITQFVFRSELCACSKPVPIKPAEDTDSYAFDITDEEELEEIDKELEARLDSNSFPIDRYKPYKLIGQGGSGSVYSCLDTVLAKKVAVKILNKLTDEQLIAFQDEAKATSKLAHSGIVNVMDFGATDSGAPYMVLDYINGQSLEFYLAQNDSFDHFTCIGILKSLLNALAYAHSQGIFHRDIKPSNIIVTGLDSDSPQTKLIDFGIAHVTELTHSASQGALTTDTGTTLAGTPKYMCPDLVNGKAYTLQSELYSVGCVMYECLTGSVPYDGSTASEILYKKANQPLPEIVLQSDEPEELKLIEVITNCLDTNPDNRYSSIEKILNELESIQADESLSDQTVEDSKESKSFNLPFIALAALLLVITGTLAFFFISNPLEEKPLTETTIDSVRKHKEPEVIKEKVQLSPFLQPETHETWIKRKAPNNDDTASIYGVKFNQEHLDKFPKDSHSVWLVESELSDPKSLGNLGKLKRLNSVLIHFCKITDKAFDAFVDGLDKNKNVRYFNIVKTPVSDHILKRINKMNYVRDFTIQGKSIDDRTLKLLRDNTFHTVKIRYTKITDKSIDELIKWKHMKALAISNNFISSQGISKFRKKRKDCRIYIVPGDDKLVGPAEYGDLLDALDN